MKLGDIQTLFDYTAWADDRILDRAAELTPAQFATAPEGGLPAVRQILAHRIAAEMLWRTRLETGTAAIGLQADDFPTVEALRRQWQEERAAMRRFLDGLDDAAMERPFRFERRGVSTEVILWHVLFQLVNHGTQHRAEVAALLTDYGHSPGDLDFFFFAMQRG